MKKINPDEVAALLFCGCKDDEDNQAKVSREYQTRIGLGADGYLKVSEQLNQLNTLQEGIANINKQLGAKFTINATGDTEEEAYAQCDAQAKQKYEEQSASISRSGRSTNFIQHRKSGLPSFTEDEKQVLHQRHRVRDGVLSKTSRSLPDTKTSTWKTSQPTVTFKAGRATSNNVITECRG